MQNTIHEDNLNRLALAIILKKGLSYEGSLAFLGNLRLHLACGEEIRHSLPLQAALLTAVNTGIRAFHGGVTVSLVKDCPCLLPWPGTKSLRSVITQLGGVTTDNAERASAQLFFGVAASQDDGLCVVCNGWQGGIILPGETNPLKPGGNSPLGGIAAGALGVALAFFNATGIYNPVSNPFNGVSLWRPDLHWLNTLAEGPDITYLPQKYWLLGLGHLGQGYLWNIGMLPYPEKKDTHFLLQDFDKVIIANAGAGLLLTEKDEGKYKTRVCAQWLEERGFDTKITERPFDKNTICGNEEPRIALCGFDNALGRSLLDTAGFDFIVEASLGGTLDFFDNIVFHTFPGSHKTPAQLWGGMSDIDSPDEVLEKQFRHLDEGKCGILAATLASKAISTSFVGAFAGSLAVAELVRGLHDGPRYDTMVMAMRALHNKKTFLHADNSAIASLAANGFIDNTKLV